MLKKKTYEIFEVKISMNEWISGWDTAKQRFSGLKYRAEEIKT